MDELKKYIYEINFSGKTVKALDSEGYYHAVYPYLKSLMCDAPKDNFYGATINNGTVTYCVVRATCVIVCDGIERTFSALGSCGSNETRIKPEHMADVAETRAMKRVIHKALDLSKYDIYDVDAMDDNNRDSPIKPPTTLNDVSVPDAVASGAAAIPERKSKLPSGNPSNGNDW